MTRIILVVLVATLPLSSGLTSEARGADPPRRPDRSPEVREALARLPMQPGVWEGEAWHRQGPGEPETVHHVEKVETRLDGQVLLFEGVATQEGRTVFEAFGTVAWDAEASRYRMTAWVGDGYVVEPEATYADGVFTWEFEVPAGPRVRYAISAPEEGTWKEDGHVTLDGGKTWYPFFGMTLRRVGAEGSGR